MRRGSLTRPPARAACPDTSGFARLVAECGREGFFLLHPFHSASQNRVMGRECLFCRIIEGDVSARIVLRDQNCVAFLDHRPLAPGHLLVMPKTHVADIGDLPDDLVSPLFGSVKLLSRALEVGLDAEGVFVAVNIRISQSVPHLHVHIVPRRQKDGLFSQKLIWKRVPYPDEESAAAVQDRIRRAIDVIRRG